MPSPLRDLLARLAAELPAATSGPADPLLDGSLAPQPHAARASRDVDPLEASGGRQPPEASREPGPGGQNAGYGLQGLGKNPPGAASPDLAIPGPWSPVPGLQSADADPLDTLRLTLEGRLAQIEHDWTQALEQLAELFRRAFATKTDHAALADRLRDIENAHVLRGRL